MYSGSPRRLKGAVKSPGLKGIFRHALSVDEAKIYKPSPHVYRLAPQKLRVSTNAIGFISANFWDIAGAKAFGFHTYWVNRSKAPAETLGLVPDETLSSLTDFVDVLKA